MTASTSDTIEFLQRQDILATAVKCPGPEINGERPNPCFHDMSMKSVKDRKDGLTWRCRKTHKYTKDGKQYSCKDVKVSIRNLTWMQDSNLELGVIVELIYLWSQGTPLIQIEHELHLSHKTVIEWSAYFRDICQFKIMSNSCKIGGPGVHVEIDESKFGKRKYYKGKKVLGQWVFGGRETEDKSKVFMVPVKNRKARTLVPLIVKWIEPGSIIHSDCWRAYSKLSKLGYQHVTVNHSKHFVDPDTKACTNRIECDWRHAKVSLPRYGVHRGLHSGYLAEFMWKRKHSHHDLFLQLLTDINSSFTDGHFTCINV